jgi:hypothetical protein
MLIVCAWCKELIGEKDDGQDIAGCPRISHGCCTPCRERLERELDALEDTEPGCCPEGGEG